jgi:hypothetical protein
MKNPSISSFTVLATDVPEEVSEDEISTKLNALYPLQVDHVTRLQDAKKMFSLRRDRDKLLNKLEHAEYELRNTSERPMTRLFPRIFTKVDAVDHFTRELEKRDAAIEAYRENVKMIIN